MKKTKTESSGAGQRDMRPPLTPEAAESQMISLAVDLARQQLMDGTASSQVITHFLKLATAKERLEREKLETENALMKAKIKTMESGQRSDAFYQEVLNAMRLYSGHGDADEYGL